MDTNAHGSEMPEMESDRVVESVIGAAYEIANVMGSGFLEKVYERALARELALRGWRVAAQIRYPVLYKGHLVGEYMADLLVYWSRTGFWLS